MLKENLRILRNLNGYSQEQIAEKIEISRQAYAKWENGQTTPDLEKAARLAEVYGVTVDSLLKTETVEGVGTVPPAPAGKNIWGSVTLGDRDRSSSPRRPGTIWGCRAATGSSWPATNTGSLSSARTFSRKRCGTSWHVCPRSPRNETSRHHHQ